MSANILSLVLHRRCILCLESFRVVSRLGMRTFLKYKTIVTRISHCPVVVHCVREPDSEPRLNARAKVRPASVLSLPLRSSLPARHGALSRFFIPLLVARSTWPVCCDGSPAYRPTDHWTDHSAHVTWNHLALSPPDPRTYSQSHSSDLPHPAWYYHDPDAHHSADAHDPVLELDSDDDDGDGDHNHRNTIHNH